MQARVIFVTALLSCLLGVEALPNEDSPLRNVGGHDINITDVPFMARYYPTDRCHFCGAVIVHERFVLSSATCNSDMPVPIFPPFTSYVTVGTDRTRSGGYDYDVVEKYAHSLSSKDQYDYDIVVLKLAKPLTFNEKVKAIPLPEKGFVLPNGASMDTMGFGISFMDKINIPIFPNQLQQVSVQYVDYDQCVRWYPGLIKTMICADDFGAGSCVLDDGGPLVYNKMLVGVVSQTTGCGAMPSIYTYIPAVRDFIDYIIKSNT